MSLVFRRIRISRRLWPLAFLLVAHSAYAISVTTSPVTMLADGTGQFTISWSGAGYTGIVQQLMNDGSWAQVYTNYNTGSTTITRAAGIWRFRIKYCNFVGPNMDFVCQYTATYSFSVLTPPSTPTVNLVSTSNTSTFLVSSTWPSTATRFEWQERKNSGAWTNLTDTGSGFDRTGRDSATWGYRVRACNAAGCSSYSAEKVIYVAITPGIPGSLSVPGNTYGALTVSWGAASGSVTQYDLDMRQGSGSYANQYDGSALTRAISVSEIGTYYLRVRACRTTVTYTSCSDWRTSTGVTASMPPVPGALSVPATNSSGAYSVSWNAITGVTRYTLQERLGSRTWATVQDTAASSKSFSGKSNSRVAYRVRACAGLGCSAYSAAKTVNVVRARTGAATQTDYAYDALGRLQFVQDSVNGNRDFDYDSAGNRTTVSESVVSEDEDPFE